MKKFSLKRILAMLLAAIMLFSFSACDDELTEQEPLTTNNAIVNKNEKFNFYFAFQELDVNTFALKNKIEKIYAFNGEDIVLYELPLSYENLIKDRTPKYKHTIMDGLDEYVETDKTRNTPGVGNEPIYWDYYDGTTGFTTYFYNDASDKIEDAINKSEWYIDIGNSIFHNPLKIPDGEYADFKDIVEHLGNPSNIYVNLFQDYETNQRCDYWLIYDYEDYSLAFNFDEHSNKTKEEWLENPMPELRFPQLEACYIYAGNSFKRFIEQTSVTYFSYDSYKEYK